MLVQKVFFFSLLSFGASKFHVPKIGIRLTNQPKIPPKKILSL